MSREVFDKSYPFIKKLDATELKQLLMFFTLTLMEISLGVNEKGNSKLEKFMDDIKSVI